MPEPTRPALAVIGALVVCGAVAGLAPGAPPADARRADPRRASLSSMTDAERAFARAAATAGIRAAFLEYLDDQAITFRPSLGLAKDVWRARPAPADPLATSLVWEPRTGDVSASGDLGWLSGPYTLVPNRDPAHTEYGCYFSIWRRQPAWRVFIDAGISTPTPCAFAGTDFSPAVEGPAERGDAQSIRHIVDADRSLDASAGDQGLAAAVAPLVAERGARFHRDGQQPIVGAARIRAFLSGVPGTWRFTAIDGAAASSGDLGYTYGRYERADGGTAVESGYYIRVWRLDHGTWRLMFDTLVATG